MHNQSFKSDGKSALIVKYWAPLLLVFAILGVFGADLRTWRFIFTVPLLLLAAFGASLATVVVEGETIRYRRWFRWHEFRTDDVIRAKRVWPPFVGAIRFRGCRFGIYFVLDKNVSGNPFGRGEFPILRYLSQGRNAPADPTQGSAPIRRLVFWGCVGILVSLTALYLLPSNPPQTPSSTSAWIALQLRLASYLRSLAVQIVALGIMLFLAARRRDHTDGSLYSFLSGLGIAGIFVRLFTNMLR